MKIACICAGSIFSFCISDTTKEIISCAESAYASMNAANSRVASKSQNSKPKEQEFGDKLKFGAADLPSLPQSIVDLAKGHGSYYVGLLHGVKHISERRGGEGEAAERRAMYASIRCISVTLNAEMNSTEIVLRFLGFLSEVQTMFRKVHLDAELDRALRDVSTSVLPFKTEASDYADHGVTICVALNAELVTPIDSDKKAIGMSLMLRHAQVHWIAEAETGWTGQATGWDQFDEREAQVATLEELMDIVPSLVEWMGKRFREEVAKLPRSPYSMPE